MTDTHTYNICIYIYTTYTCIYDANYRYILDTGSERQKRRETARQKDRETEKHRHRETKRQRDTESTRLRDTE